MPTELEPPADGRLGMSASEFWRAALQQSGELLSRQTDDEAEEAFWQDYAPGNDQKSPLAACATELIDDLRAMIGADWHMVEIGAGTGAFTRRLAPHVSRTTVVEPSAASRHGAQARPVGWNVAVGRTRLVFARPATCVVC